MEYVKQKLWQLWSVVTAAVMVLITLAPVLLSSNASAAEISSRSITMSTSAASASATYQLKFTPVSSATELIVDFCSNDPLISDTCSFSAATVPTIGSSIASDVGTASQVGTGTPVHTIDVTGLTMTGGSAFTINFTAGITNPTSDTSFYARVLTYGTGGSASYTPANTSGGTPSIGSPTDTGGIALSTTANISITSKVFETLTFCVFQTSCGTAPSLTLGDPTTGALSVANAYVNSNAQYTLATNAGHGVNVTMTGTTLCRSATPANCTTGASAYTISAIGLTPTVSSIGSEQFGMCVDVAGSTVLTAGTSYTDSVNSCNTGLSTGIYTGNSKFGFNDATTSGGTNNAAGSQVMSSTGAVPSYTGTFSFLGNIAATTEAGIYTTSLNMVATGTF